MALDGVKVRLDRLQTRHDAALATLCTVKGDKDALQEEKDVAKELDCVLKEARLLVNPQDSKTILELSGIETVYANVQRDIASTLLANVDVNGMIGQLQDAHSLLFDKGEEESKHQGFVGLTHASRYSPAIVDFLQGFESCFSVLSTSNPQNQERMWRKRIQINDQLQDIVDSGNAERAGDDVKLNDVAWKRAQCHQRNALHAMATCFFLLKDYPMAHKVLVKWSLLLKPSDDVISEAHVTFTESERKEVAAYAKALLEVAEPLKPQKKYDEAIVFYKQSLHLLERLQRDEQSNFAERAPTAQGLLLDDHSGDVSLDELGGVFNNIAMCHYHQFQHGESVPYFEQALDCFLRVHGPDVPAVQITRNNIATNKQLEQIMQQARAQGEKVHLLDLANHAATTREEEEQAYFRKPQTTPKND